MNNQSVYGLIDPITNELRYIGKSYNVQRRLSEHLEPNQLKLKTHKARWINSLFKKGLKPTFIILENNLNQKNVNEAECFYIEYYKFLGARLTNGTIGGDGGITDQTGLRCKPIIDLETGKIYKSTKEVSEDLNLDPFHIRICASGKKTHSIKGKYLSYYLEKIDLEFWRKEELRKRKFLSSRFKPIKIEQTGQIFNSIKALAEYLNVKPKQISRVLGGKRQTLKGYTFKVLSYEEFYDQ